MDFARLTREAENRTRWKRIVANPSVGPQLSCKVMGKNRKKNIMPTYIRLKLKTRNGSTSFLISKCFCSHFIHIHDLRVNG